MHAVSALLRVSIAHLCSQACSARITSAVFSEGEAFRQLTLTGNRLTLYRKPPRCSVLHASALQRSMLSEATSSRQACTSRAEGVAEVPTRWSYLVMQDSASLTGFEFEDVERTCCAILAELGVEVIGPARAFQFLLLRDVPSGQGHLRFVCACDASRMPD